MIDIILIIIILIIIIMDIYFEWIYKVSLVIMISISILFPIWVIWRRCRSGTQALLIAAFRRRRSIIVIVAAHAIISLFIGGVGGGQLLLGDSQMLLQSFLELFYFWFGYVARLTGAKYARSFSRHDWLIIAGRFRNRSWQ